MPMAKKHLKHWLQDPQTASLREDEDKEDEEMHTIFSSEEDEPEVAFTGTTSKKEFPGSEEAQRSSQAVKSGTKRRSEATSSDVATKLAKEVTLEGTIKPHFQRRLFTDEDEILVLQGMIDFKTDTWKAEGFYESVKKSTSFEVSKTQIIDKIRSLKIKYLGKWKNGVEPHSFLEAHDQKRFELSKVIWGPQGIAVESDVEPKKSEKRKTETKTKKMDSSKQELSSSHSGKKVEDDSSKVLIREGDVELPLGEAKHDWFEKSSLVRLIESFGVNEHSLKQRWSKVPIESKKKIEERLKLLEAKELECALQKATFLNDVISVVIAEAN